MKAGRTLKELAREIDRRAKVKKDFIAPVSRLALEVSESNVPIVGLNETFFDINPIAHEQIAAFAEIPMPYYRRMLSDDPRLLVTNVNRWFRDRDEERRMVRTLDGTVRALLSSKYRAMENEDLAEAVLPILMERDLIIMSCEITDQRLYIKAVDKSIEKNIPKGAKMGDGSHHIFDCLSPAVSISNSEVGRGSWLVEGGVYTRACTNLAIFGASMRKFHTGARAEVSDDIYEMLTDSTKAKIDDAVISQTRDLVAAVFDQAKFQAVVEKLQAADEDRISKKADVVEVIERVGKHVGLAEGERKGVLACLIEEGNLSRYGVHSAITRFSQEVESYDRATELERAGAKIIELPKSDWRRFAEAA